MNTLDKARSAVSVLAVAVALVAGAAPVHAVDGPGLGNLSYSAGEVGNDVSIIDAPLSEGNVAMVNGWLMIVHSGDGGGSDGGGIDFWDVSNPRSPQLHARYDNADTNSLREAHGFGLSNSYPGDYAVFQAVDGIQFYDLTDPDAISLLHYMDLPGINEGDYTGAWWVFWQAPYVYVAGVNQGLYVVDATDPTNPVLVKRVPSSQMGGLNPAVAYAIGNLLVIARNHDNGYATLDISDPENPTLISALVGGHKGYSHLFNGGKILTSGGDGGAVTMGVHNVPASGAPITFEGIGATTCGPGKSFENGGYGSVQDGVFFSGFSNRYGRFNIATRAMLGCGSSGVPFRDEDFAQVLGNLVWVGNDHDGGSGLIPHKTTPDTTGADVNWVHPPNGATGQKLTSRVGVTMTDSVAIDSLDATTFQVRPVGGAALPGKYSVQWAIVNFSPDEPLLPNTTYEVVVNGVEDLVGNAGGSFTSTFTTGDFTAPTCTLDPPAPVETNQIQALDVASVNGPGPITYAWDFGDGATTPPSGTSATSHTWTEAGRLPLQLTVENAYGATNCSAVQIVHNPLTASAPTASSPLVHDGQRSFNVNPDADTATAIDETSLSVIWEAPVGDDPKTLAIAPSGDVWVVNQGDATISVLDPATGSLQDTFALPLGSQPYGIAFAPDASAAYVSLTATGRLLRLDPATGAITGDLDVAPKPRGVAVSGDASRILVTRFISPPAVLLDHANPASIVLPEGEVREVDAASFTVTRVFPLGFDAGPDAEASGRGVPNYVSQVQISPDGLRALVPSNKDNVARGVFLEAQPLSFESRVRTIVSALDLVANVEDTAARIDLNDRDMAQSVVWSPLGDLFFIGIQGTNLVEIRDAHQPNTLLAAFATGRAPQGLVLDEDGLGRTLLYVQNLMSRSVSVFDVTSVVEGTSNAVLPLGEIATVAVEPMSPQVLLGKQIFYNAHDNRMNRDGYLSCASCHLDGGSDGQVWDFTQSGEGLRNTVELVGRAGTGHGNVHWTANFDEIQDFENDIRLWFSGAGFLADPDWITTQDPLGAPKAGLSVELDALAAYLGTFDSFPTSPYRNPDKTLTPDGVAGKAVFATRGCDVCHAGTAFTDMLRHDVGTIVASSGQGRGLALAGVGFDTPTLKGVWAKPPYLHNGQAATLYDVLENPTHVGALSATEKDQLVAYLLQIDDHEGPVCSNGIDDDGDGLVDFPADPGCADAMSELENPQCNDGMDNDGDTLVDLADPDCASASDDVEAPPPPACSNGIDDDGDGLVDFPADPGCANAMSELENPQCNDGMDNDGDTLVDLADPDCASASDDVEAPPPPACSNGIDDDGDGLIDFPADPGCFDAMSIENPKCDDDLDNDGDGKIDWDGGAGAGTPDPDCTVAFKNKEKESGCGLGAELVFAFPLLAVLRRRVRGA